MRTKRISVIYSAAKMPAKEKTTTSKFMSLALRHRPEKADIVLDEHGWTDADALLDGLNKSGRFTVTFDDIKEIAATGDKQRFQFNDDFTRIRAVHGHTVKVDLDLEEITPPDVLYHGTSAASVQGIKAYGIQPKQRVYVHLSVDTGTARNVGSRHGEPVVLTIDASKMHADGYKFYQSVNGIWLTDIVPSAYIMNTL
jgi:putative RNA 2'-phosphotransferase